MSGTNGGRDQDEAPRVSGGVDPCKKTRLGPINSPKASVLSPLAKGAVLDVAIQMSGTTPILVVKDGSGAVGGSLTFVGYLEIIGCIRDHGVQYKATIVNISGGVYEVRVEPI